MNLRWMRFFWIILTGLALALSTSPTSAQLLNWSLEALYDAPLYVRDAQLDGAPIGTLFNCQDGSAAAGESPSDITRVEVYDGLTGAPSSGGILFPGSAYVVAVYTRTPIQELLASSALMSAAIRAIDVGGHSDNRMFEKNNGVERSGAADNNFGLIDGTSQLASMSPDGKSALFSLPAKTTQMFIRTFYAAQAGQPPICYSVTGRDGGPITLPAPWASDSRPDTALVGMSDMPGDTIIYETGAPAAAPQADIRALAVYAAPFPGDYAGDYRADIILTQPLDNTISNWTLNLSVERASSRGNLENWSLDFNEGQIRNRRLTVDFNPLFNDLRFATLNEAKNVVTFVLPADVIGFQASASMKTADGQTLYDAVPNDKPLSFPTIQLAAADTANPLLTGQDESGDTVICGTNNPAASEIAPEIDITNVTFNRAPANVPVPGGSVIGIQTAQPLNFDPNRAEIASFIIRARLTDGTASNIVVDFQNGQFSSRVLDANNQQVDPQFRYIQTLYQRGITSGADSSRFDPQGNLTRGEMSVFLIRARMNSVFPTFVPGSVMPGPDDRPFFTYVQRLREMRITVGSHVAAIQVQTALTLPDGQQVCDVWPASGHVDVPPEWMANITPENQVATFEDAAGDAVDAATGAAVEELDPLTQVDGWLVFTRTFSAFSGHHLPVLGVPMNPPGSTPTRVVRVRGPLQTGEQYTITLEQAQQGQTVIREDANDPVFYPFYRPAYFDPIQNTAYFALPGGATQATFEVTATTADGRQVRDSAGPFDLNSLFVGMDEPGLSPSDPGVFAYFPTSARQGIDNDTVVLVPSPAYTGLFDMRMGEDAYNTFQSYRNPVSGLSSFAGRAADPNTLGQFLNGAYAKNRLASLFVGDDRPQQVSPAKGSSISPGSDLSRMCSRTT